MKYFVLPIFLGIALLFGPIQAKAIGPPAPRLKEATAVIQSIMSVPDQGIPANLLARAQGIAVIPGFLRAGLGIGGTYGQGVMVERRPDGSWSIPAFVTLGGASIGFQAGLESTDLVLVFMSKAPIEQVLNGQLTLGGTASVAAGPIGRSVELGASLPISSEILSYSRSKGLFAGAVLDGGVLTVDLTDNGNVYGVPNPLRVRPATVPASARRFDCVLAGFTGASRQQMCA
jgi:lipid-binding SYLF domain-containing protein